MTTFTRTHVSLLTLALCAFAGCAQIPDDSDSAEELPDTERAPAPDLDTPPAEEGPSADDGGMPAPAPCPAVPAGTKKNILLVILDDVGVDGIKAYGEHTQAPVTPTISSLASSGVLFRNVWSNPVCSPTRAGIYSGKHGIRTGVTGVLLKGQSGLPDYTDTIADALKAKGYKTGVFGKWHVSDRATAPMDLGFDELHGSMLGGLGEDLDAANWTKDNPDPTPDELDFCYWRKVTRTSESSDSDYCDTYATVANADDAYLWIQERNAESVPWMAVLAFNAAHSPYHFPPSLSGPHQRTSEGLCDTTSGTKRERYVAELKRADEELGKLITDLGCTMNNTMVIVVGDNGTPGEVMVTEDEFDKNKAKSTLYEGGINVPLIVTGPGVVRGDGQIDALAHTVDLFATIADMGGASAGAGQDSVSLWPYLQDPNHASIRSRVYTDGTNGSKAMRDERYKVIYQGGQWACYDLMSSPGETSELFGLTQLAPQLLPQNCTDLKADIQDGL